MPEGRGWTANPREIGVHEPSVCAADGLNTWGATQHFYRPHPQVGAHSESQETKAMAWRLGGQMRDSGGPVLSLCKQPMPNSGEGWAGSKQEGLGDTLREA